MKRILLISIAALLFVTSISTTFIFYNLYDKEKEHRKELEAKNEKLSTKIKISEKNNENLKVTGEQFVQKMFTYNNETFKKAQDEVLLMTKSKAKEKLLAARQPNQEDDTRTTKIKYFSDVAIKESYYNRIDVESALIIVKFDHNFTISKKTSSTPYQAKVWIRYSKGKWYIDNYELEQLL